MITITVLFIISHPINYSYIYNVIYIYIPLVKPSESVKKTASYLSPGDDLHMLGCPELLDDGGASGWIVLRSLLGKLRRWDFIVI